MSSSVRVKLMSVESNCSNIIIHSSHESNWASVREILANLRTVYNHLEKEQEMDFRFLGFTNIKESWSRAKIINQWNPQRVFFLDDSPPPSELLASLSTRNPDWQQEVFIHLYGNFTYDFQHWFYAEKFMLGKKIRFICASDRQKKLVSSFIDPKYIDVLAFPIDENVFKYVPQSRREWRDRLKIAPHEFVLVYAGRFSLQKNLILLLQQFARWLESSWGKKLRLVLAGEFDELPAPMLNIKKTEGFFYTQFHKALSEMPYSVQKKISVLSWLDHHDLAALFSAADGFISFSTHMDEDFGMAPKAANFCGVPSLLSDWGGYSNNFDSQRFNSHIPLHFKDQGLFFEQSAIDEALQRMTYKKLLEDERLVLSNMAKEQFSIRQSAVYLKSIMNKEIEPFEGFNWKSLVFLDSFRWKNIKQFGPQSVFLEFYGAYGKE